MIFGRSQISRVLVLGALVFVVVGKSPLAFAASEALGTIELSDLFLEPAFQFTEPRSGQFTIGSSYIAATWTRDETISAMFKIGSKRLIGAPARYGPAASANDLSLIEGYGQADTDYGRVRFGLIPIPFGLEGGDAERRLQFPRSLTFREARLVPLRDYGASYRIENEGFFSDWAVHNGEGGPDLDNEAWFTGRWGWEGGRFFRAGMSGSVGRTSVASTDPNGQGGAAASTAAYFNVDEASKVRVVNVFVDWQALPVKLQVEGTGGDTIQDDNVIKYRALHTDLSVDGGSNTSWLARYDTMVPRNDTSVGQITELTVGAAWRSRYNNSVLYLFGTKRIQTNVSPDVHSAMVIWRITPTASSFPMEL